MSIKTQKQQEFLAAGDASHIRKSMHKRFLRTSAQGSLDTAGHAAARLCRLHAEKGESDKTEQSS